MTDLQTFIAAAKEKWAIARCEKEPLIAQLSVLRDFTNALHSGRSASLAEARRDDAAELKKTEKKVHLLVNAAIHDTSFEELLRSNPTLVSMPTLPDALAEALGSALKPLLRPDRAWETRIVAEALSLGWQLWAVECEVKLTEVGHMHQVLSDKLWPKAILLWVEDADSIPKEGFWKGRWIFISPDGSFKSEISVYHPRVFPLFPPSGR